MVVPVISLQSARHVPNLRGTTCWDIEETRNSDCNCSLSGIPADHLMNVLGHDRVSHHHEAIAMWPLPGCAKISRGAQSSRSEDKEIAS